MVKKLIAIILTPLLILLTWPVKVFAQEVQISFDTAGEIDVIDAELNTRLGLFTEFVNFREARLFQISETEYVLEIIYQPKDKILRVRKPLSVTELQKLQVQVTDIIKSRPKPKAFDQEGRWKLITTLWILGPGFYGWAIPTVLNVESQIYWGMYLLTCAGCVFVPLFATNNVPVSDAASTLSRYGATRGIFHGLMLYSTIVGNDTNNFNFRSLISCGLLGSIAEGVLGFALADKYQWTAGTTEVIGTGGDFGIYWGMALNGLLAVGDSRTATANMLLGSGVGLVSGKLLADTQKYTRGDAYVLTASGILGAFLPLALLDTCKITEGRTYPAATLSGSLAGLWLGNYLVAGKNFTDGQGGLILLGESAGAVLGLGIVSLIQGKLYDYTTLISAAGACGGFLITYNMFRTQARANNQKNTTWNLRISPYGLLSFIPNGKYNLNSAGLIPVINCEWRF